MIDLRYQCRPTMSHFNAAEIIPQPSGCFTVDELKPGMSAERTYTISHEDVVRFSEMSGDWNPAHHDEEYAAMSIFRQRVAHGMFSVAQFSGLLGMDLPGLGTLWLKQSVEFLKPAFLGHQFRALVSVTLVDIETNTVTLRTECFDQEGDRIISGEAVVKPIPVKVRSRIIERPA